MLAFLDMGLAEMVVCGLVALILFGGRLPEVMRNLGVTYRNFRRGMEDLKQQANVDVRMPKLGLPTKPYAPMPPPTPDPAFHPPTPQPPPPPAAETSRAPEGAPKTRREDDEPPPV